MLTARLPPIAACLSLTRAIVRASSDEDIYIAALDALTQSLGISRAAVLLFDADGVMRFKAWRNLSTAYRDAVEGHSPWTADSPDPQTIVVSDVTKDPSLAAIVGVRRRRHRRARLHSAGQHGPRDREVHAVSRRAARARRRRAAARRDDRRANGIRAGASQGRSEHAAQRPAAAIRDRGRGHGHLGDGPRDANRELVGQSRAHPRL